MEMHIQILIFYYELVSGACASETLVFQKERNSKVLIKISALSLMLATALSLMFSVPGLSRDSYFKLSYRSLSTDPVRQISV